MIPTIGLMIGAYIIARMVELLSRSDRGPTTKVFAAISIIVALLSMYDLISAGVKSSGIPG